MRTFLVKYTAHPAPINHLKKTATGADCLFWITSEDEESAKQRALLYGEEMGWIFAQWHQVEVFAREHCGGDPKLLKNYDRAQKDGVACAIHLHELGVPP